MIIMTWVLLPTISGVQQYGIWGSGSHLDEKIRWYCPDKYEINGVAEKDTFRILVMIQFLLKSSIYNCSFFQTLVTWTISQELLRRPQSGTFREVVC